MIKGKRFKVFVIDTLMQSFDLREKLAGRPSWYLPRLLFEPLQRDIGLVLESGIKEAIRDLYET